MDQSEFDAIKNYILCKTYLPGNKLTKDQKHCLRNKCHVFRVGTNGKLYHCLKQKSKVRKNGPHVELIPNQEPLVSEVRLQEVIVGQDEKRRILKKVHEENGHRGANASFGFLTDQFWWSNCSEDMRAFCKQCSHCATLRPLGAVYMPKKPRLALPTVDPAPAACLPEVTSSKMFSKWGLDLIGPFSETERSNTCAIVATEYLTRWAVVSPLRDSSVETVAEFIINEICYEYTFPEFVYHDQGKEFNHSLNQLLMQRLGIHHSIAVASGSGLFALDSAVNPVIISMTLKHCFTNVDSDDWDLKLKEIAHMYRIQVDTTTLYSPFKLMFGAEPNPVDIQNHLTECSNDNDVSLNVVETNQQLSEETTNSMNSAEDLNQIVFGLIKPLEMPETLINHENYADFEPSANAGFEVEVKTELEETA